MEAQKNNTPVYTLFEEVASGGESLTALNVSDLVLKPCDRVLCLP
jgi:hypothetical protein